jgi:hypothetical protein
MNNPLMALISLVKKLIVGADSRMLETIINGNCNDICFSAPDVILKLLESATLLQSEMDYDNFAFEEIRLLDRVNIIPSVDWSITLFHKDYPLYRHDWMIRKIALDIPFRWDGGDINRTTIYINEVANATPGNSGLN